MNGILNKKNLRPTKQDPGLESILHEKSKSFNVDLLSKDFALEMDQVDPLREFRKKFAIPSMKDLPSTDHHLVNPDEECVYLCGNSLGLKPITANHYMQDILDCWGKTGVFVHFTGPFPTVRCESLVKESLTKLVGASDTNEVTIMNSLSVNLHLMMIAFYQPTSTRYKILIEDQAFPSDRYAVVSQLKLHGYSEEDDLLVVKPRPGEVTIHNEDIIEVIEKNSSQIALCLFSGVHYYTGQKFDIQSISKAAKTAGCIIGWDLTHAVGNIKLELHRWEVDFACWCSYKYLNSGPGGIAGVFVHRRFHGKDLKILSGWWGNKTETRFQMKSTMDRANGTSGFQLSNPSSLLVSLHKASLEIIEEATMDLILEKQLLLTGYLEHLIDKMNEDLQDDYFVQIITPRDPSQRGCQLSIHFSIPVQKIHHELEKRGVVCDVRLPNAMRLAPVPLYNSFTEVFRFVQILREILEKKFMNLLTESA